MADPIRELARKLARLERQIRRLSTQPQLAHSSFEGGAIEEYDPESGSIVQSIGQQWDGTHGTVQFNGPPPPQATAPTVEALAGAVRVTWDGLFEDDAYGNLQVAPMDFARVEVHVATVPDFDTNYTTTLMTTFDTPRGGSKDINIREPGIQYVRLVVRSTSGARSPDSGQASVYANWEVVLPPTTSPVAHVSPGIGAFYVSWPITANPSGYEVEVHVTAPDQPAPVVGDPATLAVRTPGTLATVDIQPNGNPLVVGETYWVWLIATNDQGSAEVNGPVEAGLRTIDTPDISANAAWVGTMTVDRLTGGTLKADTIVGSGGGIYAEGAGGERVGIWPSGFKVSGGSAVNFKTYVDFPTSGAPNIISGVLKASTLEVEGDATTGRAMNLRGFSELAAASELRLASGPRPPIAPPVVTDFYPTTQINWGTHQQPRSMNTLRGGYWDDAAGLYYFVDGDFVNPRVYWMDIQGIVQGTVDLAGKLVWDAPSGFPEIYGITRAANSWHILYLSYDRGRWPAVSRFDNTWTRVATWRPSIFSSTLGIPYSGIGLNASGNLVIATRNYYTSDIEVGVYNPMVPDGASDTFYELSTSALPAAKASWDNGPIRSIVAGTSDLGAGKMLIAQTSIVRVYSGNTRSPLDEFPMEADAVGFWYRGTAASGNFYSMSTTGSVAQYSTYRPNSAASTAYFTFTRYDASGTGYETDMGPIASHTLSPRASLKVTVSYGGAPAARLYGIISSTTTPTRTALKLQSTFFGVNDTVVFSAPLASSGLTPPLATDRPFPNGTPAQIVSTDGSTYWKGDGTAKLRELIATSVTDVTAAAGNTPAFRVGDPAGWHLRVDGNQIQAMTDNATVHTLSLNIERDSGGHSGGIELGYNASIFRTFRMGSTSITADVNGRATISHGLGVPPDVFVASKRVVGANGYIEYGDFTSSTVTIYMRTPGGAQMAQGSTTTVDWQAYITGA